MIRWRKHILNFRFDARTSRGSMQQKPTYIIYDDVKPHALGEVNLFPGLSAEDSEDFEENLSWWLNDAPWAQKPSSVRFGLESLNMNAEPLPQYPQGIAINGLIWMGDKATMKQRIAQKLDAGFKVLKLKIGGIRFEDELDLLREIRRSFSSSALELRLDANGSFSPSEALAKINQLAQFQIHSLEQPIKQRQIEAMAEISEKSEIAIALDEELIGIHSSPEKEEILSAVRPQYIILKPALCGGFGEAEAWARIGSKYGIKWWATSALESNIGLLAIARWVAKKEKALTGSLGVHGLGTGLLFDNNLPAPIELRGQRLFFL